MATALITGASQGIGACIAERLAKDGYNIAINHYPSDGDKANAEKVAETCRSYGVEVERQCVWCFHLHLRTLCPRNISEDVT